MKLEKITSLQLGLIIYIYVLVHSKKSLDWQFCLVRTSNEKWSMLKNDTSHWKCVHKALFKFFIQC